MSKILVTGGAGFIGSNFILYWVKNHPEDKIVNFDKLTYAGNLENLASVEKNSNYSFIKGDICSVEDVEKAMEGVDIAVHFAAESHVDRSIKTPASFVMTNVVGTQILLDAAVKNNVKRFHHVSCYDTKTRAYTKKGLKNYWELTTEDEVLSLNTKTKEIEWKKINRVIIQDYIGEMIAINSDRINFLVTPNHRMLLETPRAGKLHFKEAAKLGSRNRLPNGIWNQGIKINPYSMYLLGFFIGDGFVSHQVKTQINRSGLAKQEYILRAKDISSGRFLSVGRIGVQDLTYMNSYRIFLDVPTKDHARERVENTLTGLGVNWHPHSGKAGEHIYFSSKKLLEIFQECGSGALNKRIPRWALEADYHSLKALFDGLIDSDGREAPNSIRFFTSSKGLVEDFSELCIKLGYTPHVFTRKAQRSIYKGRVIKGTTDAYMITVGRTRRSIIPRYGLNHVKSIKYNGKIWCVEVQDNKNLLIERDGIFAFCGNTDEVFGALPLESTEKFNEQTKYDPRSPYSASKAASDHLVRAYFTTYNLPITITNCSNNYGPYQFPEKLIPLAITNILEDKKVPVYGDGKYVRDWLYVEDHCRAIDLVLSKGKVGETYCVGGLSADINNLEVVKKIISIMGKDESMIEFVSDRAGHDRRYAVDWSKIKNELGFEPAHNFDEWLEKIVQWYKEHEDWWKKAKSGDYQKYYQERYGGMV